LLVIRVVTSLQSLQQQKFQPQQYQQLQPKHPQRVWLLHVLFAIVKLLTPSSLTSCCRCQLYAICGKVTTIAYQLMN